MGATPLTGLLHLEVIAEGWQSGRLRQSRKLLYLHGYREFESHLLRQPLPLLSLIINISLNTTVGKQRLIMKINTPLLMLAAAALSVAFAQAPVQEGKAEKAGKAIDKTAEATVKGTKTAAKATEKGVVKAGTVVKDDTKKAAVATEHGTVKAAKATEKEAVKVGGVVKEDSKKAAVATGHGVKKAAVATENGAKKAVKATGAGLEKTGKALEGEKKPTIKQ